MSNSMEKVILESIAASETGVVTWLEIVEISRGDLTAYENNRFLSRALEQEYIYVSHDVGPKYYSLTEKGKDMLAMYQSVSFNVAFAGFQGFLGLVKWIGIAGFFGVVLCGLWLFAAAVVGLVSDANVSYTAPVVGLVSSTATWVVCEVILAAVRKLAQAQALKEG